MANVNLKVMMRLGDNRTAQEMADWVGKVATTKRSLGTGINSSVTSRIMKGSLDVEARKTGAQSQSINFSEDEDDLVGSEELKHEMSAEKGLAWFDLGDGRILKGRCLWFNAEQHRSGGAPASRLTENLAMSCGGSTMLRLVRAIPDEAAVTPRVLGVDDWAFRRAHHYGTILCNLERHRPVDLLPDRTAQSLADWLNQHPGIEIISRDRAGFYAQGAREGAPDAVQVADRFHLVHNLRDALKRMLDRQQKIIREVAKSLAAPKPAAMENPIDATPIEVSTAAAEDAAAPKPLTARQQRSQAKRARRTARYEEAVELGRKGVSQREIGRRLGFNRGTVRQYLSAGQFAERADSASNFVASCTTGH